MVVLRAIGSFFARIGRWIRDTAWVQPLLIVGGIFAIIFSIPSITKWVQSWFTTGDAALSFYKNAGYKKLDNGKEDGTGSDADKLLSFIFNEEERTEADYDKFGEKFFVTFVQEDCSTCSSIYKGWKAAKDNWGKGAGFKEVRKQGEDQPIYVAKKGDFKMYTIFVDQKNSDNKNYFWQLHDKTYSAQFSDLATLENPYKANNSSISYDGLASSEEEDLSGGSVFTTPTTLLFDREFAEKDLDDLGYSCVNDGIAKYGIAEVIFDIPDKAGQVTGTPLAKARTLWDCWNHIGQFDNQADDAYVSL